MPRLYARLVPLSLFAAVAVVAAMALGGVSAGADLNTRIAAGQNRVAALGAAIADETRRINASAQGIAAGQARLAGLQAQTAREQAQLADVQARLVRAREELTRLENRVLRSTDALRRNLVARYENPQPDLVTVILRAEGFSELQEKASFYKRIAHQNANILDSARESRTAVTRQASLLSRMQARHARLAAALAARRDHAQALQGALLSAQAARLAGRDSRRAELHAIRGRLASLMASQRRAAQVVVPSGTPNTTIATNPGGFAQAPADAPDAVKQVIAAGNAIAGLPYVYGGGHAGFQANAYDCSGSVSYALAAAGLVSSPLNSTGFESWGEAGPGRWITVYANAGHAWMTVAGWRFDTSALPGGGTRWTRAMRGTGGFVARHPPGL